MIIGLYLPQPCVKADPGFEKGGGIDGLEGSPQDFWGAFRTI